MPGSRPEDPAQPSDMPWLSCCWSHRLTQKGMYAARAVSFLFFWKSCLRQAL